MNTDIVVALIMAGATIITQIIINAANQKKNEAENEKTKALITYRLDQLEAKQDKYNHLQERVFNLEQDRAVIMERIKTANHRISDLENERNDEND